MHANRVCRVQKQHQGMLHFVKTNNVPPTPHNASCNNTTACANRISVLVGCVPWCSKVSLHATGLSFARYLPMLSVSYVLIIPPFNHHYLIATNTTTYIHLPPPDSASCTSASGVFAPVDGWKNTTSTSGKGVMTTTCASGVFAPVDGKKNTTSASCSRCWLPLVQIKY